MRARSKPKSRSASPMGSAHSRPVCHGSGTHSLFDLRSATTMGARRSVGKTIAEQRNCVM